MKKMLQVPPQNCTCTFSYQFEDKIYAEYMWTKVKSAHQLNVNTRQWISSGWICSVVSEISFVDCSMDRLKMLQILSILMIWHKYGECMFYRFMVTYVFICIIKISIESFTRKFGFSHCWLPFCWFALTLYSHLGTILTSVSLDVSKG